MKSERMKRLEIIKKETNIRKLVALAYLCEGDAKSGQMKSDEYADCMAELATKLGFGITPDNLQKAFSELVK